jgi:hypothetical protein
VKLRNRGGMAGAEEARTTEGHGYGQGR